MPTVQTITKEARVAGRVVPNVLEVTSSAGFDQINAEATIWTTERPSFVEEGQEATIWARNSGTGEGQIFGGEVVGIDWSYAPQKIGIVCRDLLARTRMEWGGGEYTYTSQDDAAVIRNLLEKMGIPSSAASIESSGWTLGVVDPIVLADGDTPYSIIQEIDDLAGYKTYSLTSGIIVRRRISGIPGAAGALTFEKGVQILADARRTRSRDGIVNRAIVTGLTYEGLEIGGPGVGEASAANPYIPDPPAFVTETIQSNLVEDDAKALEIAQRIVNDKNRRPEGIDFSIPLDPRVQPGMTVTVNHGSLETGSATVFVSYVGHGISSGGARTTIRTTGGNLSGYSLQAPIASFAVQTILEGEDTGSGVDALIVVICDGSQSHDPDGTISSYAWASTATGGAPDPNTGSGSVYRFTVEGAATEIEVTLTVTDNDGQTGALTLTVPIDTSTMLVEDLYLAYGDMSCSSDGEQSWRDVTPASGSATCCAPIAPTWQAWGTTTGHIYATFDRLQSAPVDFGAPNGTVDCTALWVHESDVTRLWAGFDDGKVYFGTVDVDAQTCAFSLAGTVPGGSIVELRESVGSLGELRATAGQGYYYSADAGQSWALQHTFDTAWRMAAGFDTNLASGLNDAAPLYDEDGAPPTVPGGVDHIRGLSFGWRQQELYAADDAANLYLGAGPSFDLSLHADTTPSLVNHMIRSGNIDRVVYMAVGDGTGDNGFCKWIPGVKPPFFVRRTGTDRGYMIGYGALHAPADVSYELILLPYGAAGAADKLFYYKIGAGWVSLTPPAAGYFWRWLAANPFQPDSWLLLGNNTTAGNPDYYSASGGVMKTQDGAHSPLWLTSDAGANWSEVTLPTPNGNGAADSTRAIPRAEWSPTDASAWYASRLDIAQGTTATLWRGTGVSGGAPATDTTTVQGQHIMPGLAGDVYFPPAAAIGVAHKAGYFTSADVFTIPAGSSIGTATNDNAAFGDIYPLTRRALMTTLGGVLYGTTDYRAAQPTSIVTVSGISCAIVGDDVYIGSSGGAVKKVADPFGAATVTTVFAAATQVGVIRSDRQNHSACAVLVTPSGTPSELGVFDGTAWTTLALPPDADTAALYDFVEVISR